MIDEKKAERIMNNISRYLDVQSSYDYGIIRGQIRKTFDARTLRTITRHYDVRSYIDVPKTMNKKFELVIF